MKKKDSTISDDNQAGVNHVEYMKLCFTPNLFLTFSFSYAEYGIVGLVHKKYLFKSRPVTIVQKTPPKERPVV